ncbi:hypothetical protein K32_13080 [Kaistia sp. 32K]|nr:hypothetical protein K32_13080 [Kaistia sp. 32K]
MSSQEGILARQMGLKAALDERTRGRSEPIVVLDAHSVVDNDRELVAVPVGVVRALAPTALVLLEAPISAVVSRRTSEERRPSRSEEAIFTEMATARSVVADYALKLRLPLAVGYVVDNFELGTLIERLLQEVRETQEKL